MSEREFPALLNQVTVAILLSGATLLFGLLPLFEVSVGAEFVDLAIVIPLILVSFIFGSVTYTISRIAESKLVNHGHIQGHREVFRKTIIDEKILSEELTRLFLAKLSHSYDTSEENIRSNLKDYYRLVASSVLKSEFSLSRTLMGLYILSRNFILIFIVLLLLYIFLPTQYPKIILVLLTAVLIVSSILSYKFMKRGYIYYLISDYISE
jgi:hypothetical protein